MKRSRISITRPLDGDSACACCAAVTKRLYTVLVEGSLARVCLVCESEFAKTDRSRRPVSEDVYAAMFGKVLHA